MDRKKKGLAIILLGLFFCGGVGYFLWANIWKATATKTTILLLETPTKIDVVAKKISVHLESEKGFLWGAKLKKIKIIKAGRYEIKKGMTNIAILNRLRNHIQKPLKLTFNNLHSLKKMAQKIARATKNSEAALLDCFTEEAFLKENGFTNETALAMYLPDTYQIYWDSTPETIRSKMLRAYQTFWNDARRKKARELGLSPTKIMILASIVHLESKHKPELPTIAGLYLNRLKKGIPLQADPTIVFALKKRNEQTRRIVKRVLEKDLKIKSPYNTYQNRGLPPGLIAMPDKSAIKAVLNSEKHSYLYMCASTEKIGTHAFATSLRGHTKNAVKYHRWISKQGIKK